MRGKNTEFVLVIKEDCRSEIKVIILIWKKVRDEETEQARR